MTAQVRPVVVGVSGSHDNGGALRYGAAEAHRTGAPLRLLHVVPDYVSLAPMVPLAPDDVAGMGQAVLDLAEATVRGLAPGLEVESRIDYGSRPIALARGSADGRLLVVGRDGRPLVERAFTGDVAAGVAARSKVPVVEVPAHWQPVATRGVVLVGVKTPDHADALLGDAMVLAAETEAVLVVAHAWKLPGGYDDVITSRVATDEWRERATAELDALLAPWRTAFPDVEVETRVVHDRPARALARLSEEADVLVLVRRAHGVPAAVHLGGTARALLRSAHCPVRIVPPDAPPLLPSLALEDSGAMLR